MPLGIVSDEVFEEELRKGGLVPSVTIPSDITANHIDIKRGRGDKMETPEIIREIIAEEAIVSGKPAIEIAKAFGVSTASVSAYKNGATSTASYNEPNDKLQRANNEVRTTIVRSARSRLMQALEHITPEKMADAKLRDIASVAKDMSAIMTNMEPQSAGNGIGAQFNFYVPQSKKEADYDIIEVTQ